MPYSRLFALALQDGSQASGRGIGGKSGASTGFVGFWGILNGGPVQGDIEIGNLALPSNHQSLQLLLLIGGLRLLGARQ